MWCVCVRVRIVLAPCRFHRALLLSTLHGSGNGPLSALGVHNFLFGENLHPGSRGRRGGRWGAKKLPMLMEPKITLRVAHAFDNEVVSFSEASLGY